jgi:hypothetical protein
MNLRKILYTLAFLLSTLLPAGAQCIQMGIMIWPDFQSKTIQPRQIFLVYGSAQVQPQLLHLCHGKRLYLWSPEDSVSLRLLDYQLQKSGTVQLLLQPSQPLQPGCAYELRTELDANSIYLYYQNRDPRTKKPLATRYAWQVATTPDLQAPLWLATPTVVRNVYSINSEGIDNYVLFSCPLRDSSTFLVKAVVQRTADKVRTTSYILPWQSHLPIGWLTCDGDVSFRPAEEYTVTFEALDAAGNRTQATSSPVPFKSPTRKRSE